MARCDLRTRFYSLQAARGLATAQRVVAEGGRAVLVDLDLSRAQAAAAELPGCIGLAATVADDCCGRGGCGGCRGAVPTDAGNGEGVRDSWRTAADRIEWID
jgi:hypothetical protein